MGKVLVITSKPDPHVDMVMQEIPHVEFIEFDPHEFLVGESITYRLGQSGFEIESKSGTLRDISLVWYRKPRLLSESEIPVDEEYIPYAKTAYDATVKAIYKLLPRRTWVSGYWDIIQAENKLYQLELAQQFGFNVPQTLVTSNAQDALAFIKTCRNTDKHVVTKTMGKGFYVDSETEEYHCFYTSRVSDLPDAELAEELSGLCIAPAIFQEEIAKTFDIRVTIIGDKIFSCAIDHVKKADEDKDWRIDIMSENLSFGVHDLLPELQLKCIDYVKAMNLKFGVIEFVLDKNGRYWFVEINPNGQWAFVQDECPALNISGGIADYFLEHL